VLCAVSIHEAPRMRAVNGVCLDATARHSNPFIPGMAWSRMTRSGSRA
jgi:hypothetical protein